MPFCEMCDKYNYLLCSHGNIVQKDNSKPVGLWVDPNTMHYFCRTCMQGFRYYEEMTLHRRRESH